MRASRAFRQESVKKNPSSKRCRLANADDEYQGIRGTRGECLPGSAHLDSQHMTLKEMGDDVEPVASLDNTHSGSLYFKQFSKK
jgi:hypothetical protein